MIFQKYSFKKECYFLVLIFFILVFNSALLSGCVTPSNNNLVDTYSYVDGKFLQRTWITKVDGETFKLRGIVSDYFCFDFNHKDRGATLVIPTTFQAANLTYLVPIVFKNKSDFSKFYNLTKGKAVKVNAIQEGNCFEVISWELTNDGPYDSALPDAQLPNSFPWGGFLKKFPDAKVSKEGIFLEDFYSMSNEKKIGSRYSYTLFASVKAYGSPALACISVESDKKLPNYEKKNYYRFKNIELVPSGTKPGLKKFVIKE